MTLYRRKYNPIPNTSLVPTANVITFKDGVANQAALPLNGNTQNDARITADTGNLYVWSISASSGLLTDWINQGDITDLKWSAIEDKPTSSVINIDDSVSKSHTQNTDTFLAFGTDNAISAITIKEYFNTLFLNSALIMFRLAAQAALTIQKMVDGIVDEYEDESGIDTVNSTGEVYDSDFYRPYSSGGGLDSNVKLLLHFNNSDSFTDFSYSPTTVTPIGDCSIVSSPLDLNGAYLYLDGNDKVTFSRDFTFNNYDWCIDWRMKPSSASSCTLFSINTNSIPPNWGFSAIHISYEGQNINIHMSSAGNDWDLASSSTVGSVPFDGNFYHCALLRDGNNIKFYRNGIYTGGFSIGTSSLFNGSGKGGIIGSQTGPYYYNGYINEVRVTIGSSVWTSDFTPYTEEYGELGISNLILISNQFLAENVPSEGRIILFEEDVDSITENTDLKAYISRDNGTTYTQITLVDEGGYDSSSRILAGTVDISSQPSGTNMKYKITTHNNKNLKLHGVGLFWK